MRGEGDGAIKRFISRPINCIKIRVSKSGLW